MRHAKYAQQQIHQNATYMDGKLTQGAHNATTTKVVNKSALIVASMKQIATRQSRDA